MPHLLLLLLQVSLPTTLDFLSSVPAGGSPMCHRFFEANYYMPSDGQMGSASNSYACPAGMEEVTGHFGDGCEGQGGACSDVTHDHST